ncbi:hypothetical protein C7974DRAFT_133162 [Boeremia exigua]|uniref:uncharacterized protein n=1 Tax=Boeremia exigua TaxID=749465 RepID=UPI001E8E340E|nr:uncharacterized protein C7974DRAFT_133162 [Boeremia exigua]KAH6639501.1 hypothetical protein C7974DRAFT_133162 [Boeremia exigua]
MTYRKESRYTHDPRDRSREPKYKPKRTTLSNAHRHEHSRYNESERVAYSPPPRRRRWAAGYIDRQSCSSNAYINTRHRSPDGDYPSDTEYITQPTHRTDDYIQPHSHHDRHNMRSNPSTRHSQGHDGSGVEDSMDGPSTGARKETQYGSDVESLKDYQTTHRRYSSPTSSNPDIEKRSDIASLGKRSLGSDIASIRSRRSSNAQSDRQSARPSSAASDIQKRKRERRNESDSDSDSEGGYISLDDYITGRSGCVSNRSVSEDNGEGSDAMGSDVESVSDAGEGSDDVKGSDVESLSDGGSYGSREDCIENEYDDRIDTEGRSRWKQAA